MWAVKSCSEALKINPEALKALTIRGTLNITLKNFDQATIDLKSAIKLDPKNKSLRAEFEKLKAEKKKRSLGEHEIMKKMFGGGLYNEKEDTKS